MNPIREGGWNNRWTSLLVQKTVADICSEPPFVEATSHFHEHTKKSYITPLRTHGVESYTPTKTLFHKKQTKCKMHRPCMYINT